jgi:hypothetical protein
VPLTALLSQALDDVAGLRIARGDYSGARSTIGEMERVENRRSRPDLARLARGSRTLGTALLKPGQSAEAAKAFERSVEICERIRRPTP